MTDVLDRAREWMANADTLAGTSLIADLVTECERLRRLVLTPDPEDPTTNAEFRRRVTEREAYDRAIDLCKQRAEELQARISVAKLRNDPLAREFRKEEAELCAERIAKLRDGDDLSESVPAEPPWRTGRKVGRTIYDATDELIGVMDTPALAKIVVDAVNRYGRKA